MLQFRHCRSIAISAVLCLTLAGCVSSTAVDDLAKASAQSATLFPAVAAIPYDECVMDHKNQQMKKVKTFLKEFAFDQAQIDSACKDADATSKRLSDGYAVLTAYITSLDKLAGGNVPTYDKNIGSISTPGLNANQNKAVTGLAGVVVDMLDKSYRQREAAKAIHDAEPFVQDLSKMLSTDLTEGLKIHLTNERISLGSLYGDDALQHVGPILLTTLYAQDKARIDNLQTAVDSFQKVFASLAAGHTILFNNRNKLRDKAVLKQLFQTASDIEKQISAVQSAFKPSTSATTKK
jgi:hypothetical protein